ncbi:Multi antimicrobial extrusion protein [Trema orientale]|uniref:Multi antimicrobial extrusion protein n=1 Tax=Trema orientale TaxID=63057 RepID=A0A2P5FZT1_TREOI|nr:Multi antimicrobial extrusion protein [Trema orientale]
MCSITYIFNNEKEVVDYVTKMAHLVCLAVVLNNLHATLSGIARGYGLQKLGAFANLGAYYFVGIPTGAALGFQLDMRGKCLWIRVLAGMNCKGEDPLGKVSRRYWIDSRSTLI